jgi:hypothetical protein
MGFETNLLLVHLQQIRLYAHWRLAGAARRRGMDDAEFAQLATLKVFDFALNIFV